MKTPVAHLPALPVFLLRNAVARQLATTSLRQAARDIGLSPNALRNFVRGAEPRLSTRAKLERWVAARRGTEPHQHATRFLEKPFALGDLWAALADVLGASHPSVPSNAG